MYTYYYSTLHSDSRTMQDRDLRPGRYITWRGRCPIGPASTLWVLEYTCGRQSIKILALRRRKRPYLEYEPDTCPSATYRHKLEFALPLTAIYFALSLYRTTSTQQAHALRFTVRCNRVGIQEHAHKQQEGNTLEPCFSHWEPDHDLSKHFKEAIYHQRHLVSTSYATLTFTSTIFIPPFHPISYRPSCVGLLSGMVSFFTHSVILINRSTPSSIWATSTLATTLLEAFQNNKCSTFETYHLSISDELWLYLEKIW